MKIVSLVISVVIAVALANQPKLLLMDEPTAGMAPRERIELMRLTARIAREKSIGVLEPGYEADLIAVEKNPLENITTVEDPLLVISNGRIAVDRLDFARTTTRSPSH